MNKVTTCQICGRAIQANTGHIANHGYKRPGNGYQTQSCWGAKALPYEQSCSLIKWAIEQDEKELAQIQKDAYAHFSNPPAKLNVKVLKMEALPSGIKYAKQVLVEYQKPANFNARNVLAGRAGMNDNYTIAWYKKNREYSNICAGYITEIEYLKDRYSKWVAPTK